ncbi:MAG: zinc ribbon domain-containing protein [Planctomycetes bacterium]|nr:zinc ribbon domain-containing protein [Planctomycetota bacterium]
MLRLPSAGALAAARAAAASALAALALLVPVVTLLALPTPAAAQSAVALRCPACNLDYGENLIFCSLCGTRLVRVVVLEPCPRCLVPHPATDRACSVCGYDFAGAATVRCTGCNRTLDPNTTYCPRCGTAVPRVVAPPGPAGPVAPAVPAAGAVLRQWAARAVEVSSQYGNKLWTGAMLVGPPDCQVEGKDGRVWCPGAPDNGAEFCVVEYATPVAPTQVRVMESLNPGCVVRIEGITAAGQILPLWEGQDPCVPGNQVLEVTMRRPFPAVNRLRLTLDTARVPGWNEIDAIELLGYAPGSAPAPVPVPPPSANAEHDEHEHGGSPADGYIGIRPDSVLTYQYTQGGCAGTLQARIHYLSARALAFGWTLRGPQPTAGYRRLPLPVLQKSYGYSMLFPDEEAGTRATATALWVSRHVHLDLAQDGRSRLLLEGMGPAEFVLEAAGEFPVTVNGRPERLPMWSAREAAGRGRMQLLDDRDGALVLDLAWGADRMTLTAADGVQFDLNRTQSALRRPGRMPRGPHAGPPAPVAPVDPCATPDGVFAAWKAAVLAGDPNGCLACYTGRERTRLAADPLATTAIFARYADALRDESKFRVRARTEVNGVFEWEVEVRVQELFWNRKAREIFQFVPEAGGYRMQVRAR